MRPLLCYRRILRWAQAANEDLLRDMATKMNAMEIIPMTEALERLAYFRARNVRPTTLYRGVLDIAGEAFQIPVYVYTRTAEARPVQSTPSASGTFISII